MNAVFTIILGLSTLILTVTAPEKVLPSFLSGASEALRFTAILFGSYSLWLGVIDIIEKSGVLKALGKAAKPLIRKLFPGENDSTLDDLTLNITANMLGTGSAATPAGISAMQKMNSSRNATMLVVLNSASLQLIPTTILAMRAEAGASTDILVPSLITTAVTTLLAVIAVKIFAK